MAHLVKIGNSQGVRIPKSLIEQTELEGKELRFQVVNEGLLISPENGVRTGWKIRRTFIRGRYRAILIESMLISKGVALSFTMLSWRKHIDFPDYQEASASPSKDLEI